VQPGFPRSEPGLVTVTVDGVTLSTDPELGRWGVVIGFSERAGGVSRAPFDSLNIASHVGDAPVSVDENRLRLLESVGLAGLRAKLTMAEQVHSNTVAVVGDADAGRGAFAASGRPPVSGVDALVTCTPDVPLALCFADCVPVILVAPTPAVAVAHAGWRGALGSIAGRTARELAGVAGCKTAELTAYIGPHIGSCHYEVGPEIMSQFFNTFGTVARADSGGLNLDAVVTASLVDAGVSTWRIARLGTCTAEATDRFFSYRAEGGRTGRHSAFACVRSGASPQSL
jgi:YfiH family protein